MAINQSPPLVTARPPRLSTGRARNQAARRDILDAALHLARQGWASVTMDEIARRAGVGKQTIYRWWPSKPAVVLDALLEEAGRIVIAEPAGPLAADLAHFLRSTFDAIARKPGTGALLRALMAEAQVAPDFRHHWRTDFIDPRRRALMSIIDAAVDRNEVPSQLDRALVADVLYGAMWYRLLVDHAPLNDHYANQLGQLAQLLASNAAAN